MRGEGQGSGACFKLAVRARLMQKPSLQPEGLPEELKRFGDVWHVENGIAEFHCLVVEGRVGIDRVCLLSGDESLPRIAQPNDYG